MKKLLTLLMLLPLCAHADDRRRQQRRERGHNYIISRQEAYPGLGLPSVRRIIGKREIDVYRNGMMFEKDNLVGIQSR